MPFCFATAQFGSHWHLDAPCSVTLTLPDVWTVSYVFWVLPVTTNTVPRIHAYHPQLRITVERCGLYWHPLLAVCWRCGNLTIPRLRSPHAVGHTTFADIQRCVPRTATYTRAADAAPRLHAVLVTVVRRRVYTCQLRIGWITAFATPNSYAASYTYWRNAWRTAGSPHLDSGRRCAVGFYPLPCLVTRAFCRLVAGFPALHCCD